MAEEDQATFEDHTKLDEDDAPEVDAGGTTLSQADQGPLVHRMLVVEQLVRQAIENEQKFMAGIRDSPNASFEVQFKRIAFPVETNPMPIMIVKEKEMRRRVLLINHGANNENIYVGRHNGITPGGLDTVQITGTGTGNQLEIYTRRALWAVASPSPAAPIPLSIQEEFE